MEHYGLHVSKDSLKYGFQKESPLSAVAFFLSSPQVWVPRKTNEKECQLFRSTLHAHPLLSADQIVVHGCYLLNPASERVDVRKKTETLFVNELQVCDALGVGKYVFHPGTYSGKDVQMGLQTTVDLIQLGLRDSQNVQILVENMTKSHTLCQTWQEMEWVIKHVNDRRVGCCMDTAHCWGAGECKGMFMDTLLDDFSRIVGIEHLRAIHLNDSKAQYGSNKDLHEDILKGQLPTSFWTTFPFDERVRKIPAIMETPSNCHPVLQEILKKGKGATLEKFIEKKEEVAVAASSPSWLEAYLPEDYKAILTTELRKCVKVEADIYEKERVFPVKEKIFAMFSYCSWEKIKVVILGQDPYHEVGQAEGMAFSVPEGVKIPSSLKNIFKELASDVGFTIPKHGNLKMWAEQGVLLLNTVLTVKEGEANSHKKKGWLEFTNEVIKKISKEKENVVFLLWGKPAQQKASLIDQKKHLVLMTAHPSGLSAHRGFFGCKHFSQTNEYLQSKGKEPIVWQI